MNKPSRSSRGAFSVIELLATISIISVLAVVVTPAVTSICGASGTTRGVAEVSSVLEHARQSAMRMSTWVWVGVADSSEFEFGPGQLSIVELASRDGSSDTAASNLMPLRAHLHVKGVSLAQETASDAVVLGGTNSDAISLKWSLPFSSGRREIDFSGRVVGFSPRGEAWIGTQNSPAWIKIPLAAAQNGADKISVLLSGPSGQVIVAR
jgi:prepilin-type N-terminal cleavage/methylation domain-containing protein